MSTPNPTDALYAYFADRPISVLDDLVQQLMDDGHPDLAHVLHDCVLIPLDARLPRVAHICWVDDSLCADCGGAR